MAKYHINPETGNPGLCRAERKCPFQWEAHHTNSKEEARENYEKTMDRLSRNFHRGTRPLPKLDASAYLGLEDAQLAYLAELDSYVDRFGGPRNILQSGEKKRETLRRAISRVLAGDRYDDTNREVSENFRYLNTEDRLVYMLTESENGINSQSEFYAALVFPYGELNQELKRLGLDGLSVRHLNNSREQGLIYTLIDPQGKTRSFSLYEHRNTDSLIINGTTNWDGEGLPYAGETKYEFFAEIPYREFKQAASSLSYFLSSAKKGTLEEDKKLVEKAEHLDWNAIIAKQIPAFHQWLKRQGVDPLAPNEIDKLKEAAILEDLEEDFKKK